MRLLITGICGFVGSVLAVALRRLGHQVTGIDNLIRAGSQRNQAILRGVGISVVHGDIRLASDLETLPEVDFVIDAAANASVLAGLDGRTSSRQLVEHNLVGSINLLEFCRRHRTGFILLSTSRVYHIPKLAQLEVLPRYADDAGTVRFVPNASQAFPQGITQLGVNETYATSAPISLYGATKLASETLACEYGMSYGFRVWINRCGVMAGPGQFGHPAQGIFAYWIHSFREGKPLKYIGFNGDGSQVRDCFHPEDLIPLLEKQLHTRDDSKPVIVNVSGGLENSRSLSELTRWCQLRYPKSTTSVNSTLEDRPFDIPWMVLDSSLAKDTWAWKPQSSIETICNEIADFADKHPNWLESVAQI